MSNRGIRVNIQRKKKRVKSRTVLIETVLTEESLSFQNLAANDSPPSVCGKSMQPGGFRYRL